MRAMIIATTAIILLTALSGCGSGERKWELTAENMGDAPCTVAIRYGEDGSRSARVDDLKKGKAHVLLAESVEAPIREVKIVRGKDEKVYSPEVRLTAGKRYALVVSADGTMTISAVDK
jgi:hypothetical protein